MICSLHIHFGLNGFELLSGRFLRWSIGTEPRLVNSGSSQSTLNLDTWSGDSNGEIANLALLSPPSPSVGDL